KLIPTYQQLVEGAKPPLPEAERALALDYAAKRETWDALLKRPFSTLKADGPFVLDRAGVTASAVDALGSSGDPPTTLPLTPPPARPRPRAGPEGPAPGGGPPRPARAGRPPGRGPAPAEPLRPAPVETQGSKYSTETTRGTPAAAPRL